jgi:hypothetical protein
MPWTSDAERMSHWACDSPLDSHGPVTMRELPARVTHPPVTALVSLQESIKPFSLWVILFIYVSIG